MYFYWKTDLFLEIKTDMRVISLEIYWFTCNNGYRHFYRSMLK